MRSLGQLYVLARELRNHRLPDERRDNNLTFEPTTT